MTDERPAFCDEIDIGFGDPDAVAERHVRPEQAEIAQIG